eukprot:TRINITY_DN9975_c0_g1_i1.p1 TRINITY_DN9975_c0_g1~~TRINITY_DN9975_c0_g1_i1.p1  ORF type:complete len:580 (+),score=98.24 TRINITY_DN9975_c0_g1_i1:63-1742(+)
MEEGEVLEQFSVCVLGGGAAGKSSIIVRYISNIFDESGCNDPTLLDEYVARVPFRGRNCIVTFMDTAGQNQYAELREDYIAQAHAFLLLYDVTSRLSYEEVQEFLGEICRVRSQDPRELPVLMLGNKKDASADVRQVSVEEGVTLAKDIGCPLIEVSAKSGSGVQESLNILMAEIAFHWWKGRHGMVSLSRMEMMMKPSKEERERQIEEHHNMKWTKRWCEIDGTDLHLYRIKKLKAKKRKRSKLPNKEKAIKEKSQEETSPKRRKKDKTVVDDSSDSDHNEEPNTHAKDGTKRKSDGKRAEFNVEQDDVSEGKWKKGRLDETIDLSCVLGVKKARNETAKENAFLIMTTTQRYYMYVDDENTTTQQQPAPTPADLRKQQHLERRDWMYDIRKYASRAQFGAAIGNGRRYDALQMPKIPKLPLEPLVAFAADAGSPDGSDSSRPRSKRKSRGSRMMVSLRERILPDKEKSVSPNKTFRPTRPSHTETPASPHSPQNDKPISLHLSDDNISSVISSTSSSAPYSEKGAESGEGDEDRRPGTNRTMPFMWGSLFSRGQLDK